MVGRITGREFVRPLVLALKNTDQGMFVDAVMLKEDDVSIVFGYTRSYFHVDLERVGEAVVFLRQLVPRKPVSELFTVLGRAKQGKTERYREIVRHLARSSDQFVHAAGERGLVMVCFTLPSLDVVFKLIRDRFAPPKNVLRQDVLDKYKFVFRHDRAGRLVDAQEFKRIRLPLARFAPELLEELFSETTSTVHVDGDDLIFDHMYIERRMVPLNLYLRDAPPEAAARAVLDYGQAIRDLAYTNIFAGDLLLKNFGVTRHGRVIFYDYDELCQVSECRFRDVPQATQRRGRNARRGLVLRGRERRVPGDLHQLPRLQRRAARAVRARARRHPGARFLAQRSGEGAGGRDDGGAALSPASRAGREQRLAP